MEIYFLKGLVDAEINCDKNFLTAEADSLGEIIIKDTDYARLLKYMNELKEKPEVQMVNCNMHMQCNVHSKGDVNKRLCISNFNCMIVEGRQVLNNDSLIYLLRNYSGYYNYFTKESLSIFKELKIMGEPSNYKDLSEIDKSSNKFYGRIILRPEGLLNKP